MQSLLELISFYKIILSLSDNLPDILSVRSDNLPDILSVRSDNLPDSLSIRIVLADSPISLISGGATDRGRWRGLSSTHSAGGSDEL